MIRLLQIEFIKLWNNRSSKILIFTYFILITSIALVSMIKFDFGDIHFQLADQGIFNFPYIWHFNTFFVAWFKLFLAIVIVSMMANEYSNKTIKQNLIDGLSKKEFVLSKFLTVLVFALVSTLFVFVVSLILGLIYSDYNEVSIIFSDLEFILAYFLKLTGFFSFCQRDQNAGGRVNARTGIGHCGAGPHWAATRLASNRHQAAHALGDLIEAGARGVRAVLSEAGNRGQDDAWVDGLQ
mgnify:CR=1 FL=1